STAIGPSRAHPLTGQILDADVVLTDGWIRAYWGWYNEQMPEMAVESLTPETLQWLEQYPEWDPRLLLASPEQRERILAMRAERDRRIANGEDVPPMLTDPALWYNEDLAAMAEWVGCEHRHCMAAHGLAFEMSFAHLNLQMLGLIEEVEIAGDMAAHDNQLLDGIPEWFVGPLLAELTAHEVGHTLGL